MSNFGYTVPDSAPSLAFGFPSLAFPLTLSSILVFASVPSLASDPALATNPEHD